MKMFALPPPELTPASARSAVNKLRPKKPRSQAVYAELIDYDIEPSPDELSGFCGCCGEHLVWWEIRRWRVDGDEDVHECRRCGAVVSEDDVTGEIDADAAIILSIVAHEARAR